MSRPSVLVPVSLYVSKVFKIPLAKLWPVFSDFGDLSAYAPAAHATIEDGAHPKQIGATRCITIDGREGTLREYLIAIDEGPHPSVTYGFHPTRPGEKSLVERPRYDCVNTVALLPVTMSPDSTYVSATSNFLTEPQDAASMEEHTRGYFTYVRSRCETLSPVIQVFNDMAKRLE